jgi:hypothetical protein
MSGQGLGAAQLLNEEYLLEYDGVHSDRSALMLRRNVLSPSSGFKKAEESISKEILKIKKYVPPKHW